MFQGQSHETARREQCLDNKNRKLCRQVRKLGNPRLFHPLVVHGSSLWVRTKLTPRLPVLSTTHVSDMHGTQRGRARRLQNRANEAAHAYTLIID